MRLRARVDHAGLDVAEGREVPCLSRRFEADARIGGFAGLDGNHQARGGRVLADGRAHLVVRPVLRRQALLDIAAEIQEIVSWGLPPARRKQAGYPARTRQ